MPIRRFAGMLCAAMIALAASAPAVAQFTVNPPTPPVTTIEDEPKAPEFANITVVDYRAGTFSFYQVCRLQMIFLWPGRVEANYFFARCNQPYVRPVQPSDGFNLPVGEAAEIEELGIALRGLPESYQERIGCDLVVYELDAAGESHNMHIVCGQPPPNQIFENGYEEITPVITPVPDDRS